MSFSEEELEEAVLQDAAETLAGYHGMLHITGSVDDGDEDLSETLEAIYEAVEEAPMGLSLRVNCFDLWALLSKEGEPKSIKLSLDQKRDLWEVHQILKEKRCVLQIMN